MKIMATDGKAAGRRFKVLLEWDPDEQVWVTYVPTLGQLSTYAETRDEALEQTREAIIGYLEAAVKEGIPIPRADTETEVVDLEVASP
jgi:antitoxin HicB